MDKRILTFNDYLYSKYNNSILTRFENLCNDLTAMLGMPVVIAGLHTKFKNAVSGVEKDIRQITPRCVLTFNGIDMDRSATTSVQTATGIQSVNSTGSFADNILEYRRLPLNANFSAVIVMDEPALAIRMSEYIMMLAFQFPHVAGDEHTITTLVIADSANIDNDQDKNDYRLSFSIKANMQIIEPMVKSIDETQYPLVGVGTQNPDGTWDETPLGEPVKDDKGNVIYDNPELDKDGNPIIDADGNPKYGNPILDADGNPILDADGNPTYDDIPGNPLLGNFVEHGWWRLRHHILVHPHRQWDDCLHSQQDPASFMRKPGAIVTGTIPDDIEHDCPMLK